MLGLLPAETSAASQITICGYERIKFELISIGSKGKQFFSNFQPHMQLPLGRGWADRITTGDRSHHVWRH
jgi:hypothetical protein